MTAGKTLEIGGPDKMTYEQMMRLYSSIINRNLNIIQIPFLIFQVNQIVLNISF